MPKPTKIFFDGGCRPNPGMMEIAVVARGQSHVVRALGSGTNNDAEWLALIHALRIALELEVPEFVLLGDSAIVVHQANREWKCRSAELQAHLDAFEALAAGRAIRVRRIKRAQNLAGIVLEKLRA